MPKLVIDGGGALSGKVKVNGAKNAALPIMAASLLVEDNISLKKIPDISDVWVMVKLLKSLGAKINFKGRQDMDINCRGVSSNAPPYELVKKIHASFDIVGSLLARFKQAEVPLPGGCVIGTRAVDMHIEGFRALGAEVVVEHGVLKAKAKRLKGAKIHFSRSSVGATKNIIMVACMSRGKTVIQNAACEPEIVDLANFLNKCGAKIKGMGTREIRIEGVSELNPVNHKIIPDRIEAGTFLIAGAITAGEVMIEDISPAFLEAVLTKLEAAGQVIERGENYITIIGQRPVLPTEVTTAPFPGFPTDIQPPMAALLAYAKGTSIVEETIFDGRFNYVDELRRMGADIIIKDRNAVIRGVEKLTGAPVEATDIRAGAALILAALAAKGTTEVSGLEFIDRGYEKIEKRLSLLGAKIRRI